MKTRYGIIGCGGYIAPRHMAAIQATGGEIVLACDLSDSVGILDSFEAKQERYIAFTTSPNDFFVRCRDEVDIVTVATPNGQHTHHALEALEAGCDVVVEKPLGICGADADAFIQDVKGYEGTVYPVVQLRHHPEVGDWLEGAMRGKGTVVTIDYGVYRGDWYRRSWKGREISSGGLAMNIGVHLFDLCIHLFGEGEVAKAYIDEDSARGTTFHERADVLWRLSINSRPTRRTFAINGHELDMSAQIGKLHDAVYAQVAQGIAWPLEDVARAIHLIDRIKRAA